jgi:hypothetical protein
MTWTPSSPVTGGPQTNLTSPTYTLTADTAPTSLGKQYAVTALGGTQTGVQAHSVAQPFTISFFRPQNLRTLQPVDLSGVLRSVPRNVYKQIVRKGVLPLAGQSYITMLITTLFEVPAGADLADAPNVRAAMSLAAGVTWAESSDIGDTLISGILG